MRSWSFGSQYLLKAHPLRSQLNHFILLLCALLCDFRWPENFLGSCAKHPCPENSGSRRKSSLSSVSVLFRCFHIDFLKLSPVFVLSSSLLSYFSTSVRESLRASMRYLYEFPVIKRAVTLNLHSVPSTASLRKEHTDSSSRSFSFAMGVMSLMILMRLSNGVIGSLSTVFDGHISQSV